MGNPLSAIKPIGDFPFGAYYPFSSAAQAFSKSIKIVSGRIDPRAGIGALRLRGRRLASPRLGSRLRLRRNLGVPIHHEPHLLEGREGCHAGRLFLILRELVEDLCPVIRFVRSFEGRLIEAPIAPHPAFDHAVLEIVVNFGAARGKIIDLFE
jgi:hypothetical protein